MMFHVSHFYVVRVDLHVCTVHVVAGSHLYMYVAVVWRPLRCGVY